MELYKYTEPYDYLEHHGTKGMRWGVRRYQNKDGSLTPLGERHRRTLGEVIHDHKVKKQRKAALEKARATKAANKEAAEKAAAEAAERRKKLEAGKIPIKKMTDEELKWTYDRQKAEKDLKDKMIENSPGRRFVKKMYDDALVPAVTNAAKDLTGDLLKKYGKEYLGLNEKESAYDKLKKQHEMAKWKKEIQENKDWFEDRDHIREVEKSKRDADIAKNKKNERLDKDAVKNRDNELAKRQAKKEKKQAKRETEAANKKAMEEYEAYQKKYVDDHTAKPNTSYSMKGAGGKYGDFDPPAVSNSPLSTGKSYANNYTSSNRSASSVPESHRISGKDYVDAGGGRTFSIDSDGTIEWDD